MSCISIDVLIAPVTLILCPLFAWGVVVVVVVAVAVVVAAVVAPLYKDTPNVYHSTVSNTEWNPISQESTMITVDLMMIIHVLSSLIVVDEYQLMMIMKLIADELMIINRVFSTIIYHHHSPIAGDLPLIHHSLFAKHFSTIDLIDHHYHHECTVSPGNTGSWRTNDHH